MKHLFIVVLVLLIGVAAMTLRSAKQKEGFKEPGYDGYTFLGYIINPEMRDKDAGDNSWKLYARKAGAWRDVTERKYEYDWVSGHDEFVLIPTNVQYKQQHMVKIVPGVVVGDKIRTADDVPEKVEFSHGFFLTSPYTFVKV